MDTTPTVLSEQDAIELFREAAAAGRALLDAHEFLPGWWDTRQDTLADIVAAAEKTRQAGNYLMYMLERLGIDTANLTIDSFAVNAVRKAIADGTYTGNPDDY